MSLTVLEIKTINKAGFNTAATRGIWMPILSDRTKLALTSLGIGALILIFGLLLIALSNDYDVRRLIGSVMVIIDVICVLRAVAFVSPQWGHSHLSWVEMHAVCLIPIGLGVLFLRGFILYSDNRISLYIAALSMAGILLFRMLHHWRMHFWRLREDERDRRERSMPTTAPQPAE
jgi:hypothetical protein